jgi:hypothetical protein
MLPLIRERLVRIHKIEHDGTVAIMVGEDEFHSYIARLIDEGSPQGQTHRIMPVCLLKKAVRRWGKNNHIIFFQDGNRLSKIREASGSRLIVLPHFVGQSVELPQGQTDLTAFFKNSTTKNDLNKIRDSQLEYKITKNPEDLDFFYHRMHRPYIRNRHGEAAAILSWEDFQSAYEKMELLLVCREGKPLSGSLNVQTGETYTLHVNGVLDADPELMKLGVFSALYWFSLVEAYRRGCVSVNLLYAPPFLKDGVLVYKKKWGGRIDLDPVKRTETGLLFTGNQGPLIRFLERNPFICKLDDRLASLIFLGPNTVLNDKELSSYLKSLIHQGPRLTTWIVALNKTWAERCAKLGNLFHDSSKSILLLDFSDQDLSRFPEYLRERHNQVVTPQGIAFNPRPDQRDFIQ